ncbi:hypothetical protein FOA52_004441 [Chlamydomonas sp. UWO 241]|nr:hypothetical protein FOA52_004441 [Chlamydomonas sp. UWO 241]
MSCGGSVWSGTSRAAGFVLKALSSAAATSGDGLYRSLETSSNTAAESNSPIASEARRYCESNTRTPGRSSRTMLPSPMSEMVRCASAFMRSVLSWSCDRSCSGTPWPV